MVKPRFFYRISDLFVHFFVSNCNTYYLVRYSGLDSARFINTLLAVILFCITPHSYATGPSSAHIYIKPVTYNDKGVVLFKAYHTIDYLGAPSDRKFSYWWLVVSASGIWEEVPHKILKQPGYGPTTAKKSPEKEAREDADFWKTVDIYYEEFASNLDWGHPPKSLLPLIKKYGFKPRPSFNENEGQGTVMWSWKGLCMYEKCTKTVVPQRTLGGKLSSEAYTNLERKGEELIEVASKPIPNVFYHAGVALFRNGNFKIVDGKYEENPDLDEDSYGATFDFNRGANQVIDYHYIDAISIVPKHLQKQSNSAPAKR